jgi:hypothetical protein
VVCPSAAKAECKGVIRLQSGKRRLGSRSFAVAPGQGRKREREVHERRPRSLRRHKSLRVQIIVDATAGGERASSTARITVRPASARLKVRNVPG